MLGCVLLCLMGRNKSHPPAQGEKFGRWTVTGQPVWHDSTHRAVPCRCDCGTERIVLVQSLRRSDRALPSCGCWRREQSAQQSVRQWTTHGLTKHPLYQLWKRINRRCYDTNAHNYRWYGGAGVQVWEGWRHDAAAFITYVEQELGPRPSPRHSIDRIDPYGNYEPGKIRWADPVEQARNRRSRSS